MNKTWHRRKFRPLASLAVVGLIGGIVAAGCGGGGGKVGTTPTIAVLNPTAVASSTTADRTPGALHAPAGATTIELSAKNIKFSTQAIEVAANSPVIIKFDNQDTVLHNFSLYTNKAATTSLFTGPFDQGPKSVTYQFTAPGPGTYFFRCDAHPNQMYGEFTAK